jgi:hypothetical protein
MYAFERFNPDSKVNDTIFAGSGRVAGVKPMSAALPGSKPTSAFPAPLPAPQGGVNNSALRAGALQAEHPLPLVFWWRWIEESVPEPAHTFPVNGSVGAW